MEKELIKKNAYDRIIYDTEYPSYTSSYCKMMRDYTEKYGVIDDRELVEAVFLYRGYIIENISEDIKKDKEFLINMFELYPFFKEILNTKSKNETFVNGIIGDISQCVDESLLKDDDVLVAMLIADPALARNDRYIKFPKEVILKALDRTMETNSLLWYSINKEICDFIRFDEYLDDEEFLLEILKYEPYKINDCSKDKDFIIRSLEYNPDIYQYLSDSLKNDEDIVEKLIRSDPTYDLRVIPKEVREIVVNKLKEELRERLLKEKNYATSGFFEKLSIKKKIKEELRGNNWVKYFIKDSSNKSILGYIESPADYFDYSYSRIFDDYVNNALNLDLLVLGENDLEEEEKIKEIKKVFSEAIKKNKDKFMEEFTNVTLQKNFYNYIHNYSNADNEEEQKAIIKASLDDSITSISNFIARYAIDINKTIKVEEKDEDDDQLTIYSEDKEKIKKIFSNPILLSYYLDKLEEFEDIKVSDIVDGSDDFIKEASNIIKEKCIRTLEEMKTSQPKETTKIVTEEETVEVEKKEIKHKK